MKVHLIKKQTIEDFASRNARSWNSFTSWLNTLKRADWNEPADIVKTFGSADLLHNGSRRVVFNIAGNHYRMICKYTFGESQVHLYVCWIGTHADYDKLCSRNEQHSVNFY